MSLVPPPSASLSGPPYAPPSVDGEHLTIRIAARQAEDAGNLTGARRLLALLGDDAEVHRWRASLDAGLRCADDATRALWLLQPAFRHGCATARRHVLNTLAADVLRTRGVAAVAGEPRSVACATQDPLLVDAGLFDLGMLADYVTRVLTPAAHPLVAVLQSWVGRPATVCEVQSAGPERWTLRDLSDGRAVEATAVHADAVGEGELLYGRLLPLDGVARFAMPPVPVDRTTGRRVLRAVVRAAPLAERLRAIASHQRRSRTAPS